jgi:hypothetical protein
MTNEIEVPFNWHCPKCGHAQTDTVNPDLGPYLNVTCGRCHATSEQQELTAQDAAAWEFAMLAADLQEKTEKVRAANIASLASYVSADDAEMDRKAFLRMVRDRITDDIGS